VVGWLSRAEGSNDDLCRRITCVVGTGSEEGARLAPCLFTVTGVTGGARVPVILRAILRNGENGETDREMLLFELGALDILEPLGGVMR